MNALPDDGSARLRWGVYWLLIAIATGGILGRILAVNSVDYVRLEQHLKRNPKRRLAKAAPVPQR